MTPAERARRWYGSRTFHHSQFPPERLAAERTRSVSVCVPARNEEWTVGAIVSELVSSRERGAIVEVVAIDGGWQRAAAATSDAGILRPGSGGAPALRPAPYSYNATTATIA